jgi:MFS family permease
VKPVSIAGVRAVLPLTLITGTSMLAMDLYLPAVPALQASLGVGVSLAQATVALFLAGLAASQLLWGEALTRWGPRRCLLASMALLVLTGFGCALAPGIEALLVLRTLQGAAAGAAAVVAPSVVRATLSDADAARGFAAIGMVESSVPAAAPVLGALLLSVMDWRGLFWLLGGLALLALPLVVRVVPRELPGLDRSRQSGYRHILGNRKYLRLGLSHSLCFAALLAFVASAPQLVVNALGLHVSAFATLQVLSVASFMAVSSQAGRIGGRLAAHRPVRAVPGGGAAVHAAICGGGGVLVRLLRGAGSARAAGLQRGAGAAAGAARPRERDVHAGDAGVQCHRHPNGGAVHGRQCGGAAGRSDAAAVRGQPGAGAAVPSGRMNRTRTP